MLILLVLWLLLPQLSFAAPADPLPLTPGCQLAWNYEPNELLVSFMLYRRAEHDAYPLLPTKIIPVLDPLPLRIPCNSLVWSRPGVYYLVLTACCLPATESDPPKESDPSNELAVRWGAPEEDPESPPPPRKDRRYLPPPPPPIVPPPPPPDLPSPRPRDESVVECLWNGSCRR